MWIIPGALEKAISREGGPEIQKECNRLSEYVNCDRVWENKNFPVHIHITDRIETKLPSYQFVILQVGESSHVRA